ncbi:MAG TPA: helix-turn-helix transcriptional regulator [Rhizomicrobium sp.]
MRPVADEKRSGDNQAWSGLVERSTDAVQPRQRLQFWFESTSKRMECVHVPDIPVQARVRALVDAQAEFLDYTSQGFLMNRSQAMCDADDRDQISIGLVMSARTGAVQNERELRLKRGQLYAIDFSRPVRSITVDHHELAVFLPRQAAREAVGSGADDIGGRLLSNRCSGGILSSHMRTLSAEAHLLTHEQQTIALRTASDLALATLQARMPLAVDLDRFADSLYGAALAAIDRNYADHDFTPRKLAALMGCSRASLYRLFSRRSEGVAEAIRMARLRQAHRLLCGHHRLTVTEVAFRCGFLDLSSFARIYRQHYGHTPREAGRHGAR